MNPIVQLNTFIGEMEVVGDEIKVFLNIKTGKFIPVSNEILNAAESEDDLENYPEWERLAIEEAKEMLATFDDYRELPSKFDIDDYSIMRNFCYSVEDEDMSTHLENSIRGSGAFRRFKDVIYAYGISDDWYTFRENEYKKIAREWLDDNNITYID